MAELSVWTIPALDVLVPAVQAALWKLKPTPSVSPKDVAALSGQYYDGSVSVGVEDGALVLRLSATSHALNLTRVADTKHRPSQHAAQHAAQHDHEHASQHAYRVHPTNSSAGCRWLDDGQDDELAIFTVQNGTATALAFMDALFYRFHGP